MPELQEIHYIFDRTHPDASILTANPEEVAFPAQVATSPAGEFFDTAMNGGFIVRVPAGLDFDANQPRTASDAINMFAILAEKSAALLNRFPGFSLIVFDDMLDAAAFDSSTASGTVLGGRNGIQMGHRAGAGGSIPATVDTVATALGSTPAEAVVYLEAYQLVPSAGFSSTAVPGYPTNPKADRMEMYFRPIAPGSYFQIDVSFNGGSTFITNIFSEDLINIDPADQGSSLILRLTRKNLQAAYIGISGWAVIY